MKRSIFTFLSFFCVAVLFSIAQAGVDGAKDAQRLKVMEALPLLYKHNLNKATDSERSE